MEQKDKELLLKDLCARLPYGVKTSNGHGILKLSPRTDVIYIVDNGHIPYLRPLSSMTEEEKEELYQKTGFHVDDCILGLSAFDWFNEYHFDYRGLIPMGLALEAPNETYKTE